MAVDTIHHVQDRDGKPVRFHIHSDRAARDALVDQVGEQVIGRQRSLLIHLAYPAHIAFAGIQRVVFDDKPRILRVLHPLTGQQKDQTFQLLVAIALLFKRMEEDAVPFLDDIS